MPHIALPDGREYSMIILPSLIVVICLPSNLNVNRSCLLVRIEVKQNTLHFEDENSEHISAKTTV